MIKYWIRSCVDNLLKTDPSVEGCIFIYIYITYFFKKIEKVEKIDRMKKLTRKGSFFKK
jgi:hypothetical protein